MKLRNEHREALGVRRFPPLSSALCRSARQSGPAFTLIEVILAVGIFALVLVAINTVFFAAIRLRQTTTNLVEESIPLDRALVVLRRDLQNAVPPGSVMAGDFRGGLPTSGGLGNNSGSSSSSTVGNKGVGSTVAGQSGGQPSLDFFATTGALSDAQPWGDLQEVNYQLMEPSDRSHYGRDLIRSVTRNLLANSSQLADSQCLLSNVASVNFSFYDGNQWRDSWDTSSGDTGLPLAVRVSVQMAVNNGPPPMYVEPVQLLVLLDVQSSTNSTTTASTTSTGGTQ